MCRSMVDIQSSTAEIRRGKKERRRRNRMKIYMVSLLHRATINKRARDGSFVVTTAGDQIKQFNNSRVCLRCQAASHGKQFASRLHRVSKNVPPLACYNFDAHEWILIFFGRNVTDKVGNQKTLYYATSNNLHYLAKRGNMQTTYFTQLDCITHTMHLSAIFLKEKIVISDVFDSV